MSVLNENMFMGRLEIIEDSVTVAAYDEETPTASVSSNEILLPKDDDMAFGIILAATSSGTVAVKIELEQSNDGTNWGVPADVSAMSSSWDGVGLFIKNITPDVAKYARLKFTAQATHDASATISINFNLVD